MLFRHSFTLILLLVVVNVSLISQEENRGTKKDSSSYQWEQFSVNIGGFLTSMNNDISVRGTGLGLGVVVKLEEALGLDVSQFIVRSNMEYHFGSRKRSAVRMGAGAVVGSFSGGYNRFKRNQVKK